MGLAVMVELPLVVIDVQRAGPSTGMPTKNEQADLLQVMFGRNSDSPLPIVAPATPGECFDLAIEAWRIALKYMTPVVYLSDAFLATGSEPWQIPADRPTCPTSRSRTRPRATSPFQPYLRDPETLARPWAVPARRASSTASAASRRPTSPATSATTRTTTTGCSPAPGEGRRHRRRHPAARGVRAPSAATCSSSAGARPTARSGPRSSACSAEGRSVAHAHLRHLNPFPANTEEVLRSYRRVLIPEVNLGQLLMLIRARTSSTPSATTRSAASRSGSPRSSKQAERIAQGGR